MPYLASAVSPVPPCRPFLVVKSDANKGGAAAVHRHGYLYWYSGRAKRDSTIPWRYKCHLGGAVEPPPIGPLFRGTVCPLSAADSPSSPALVSPPVDSLWFCHAAHHYPKTCRQAKMATKHCENAAESSVGPWNSSHVWREGWVRTIWRGSLRERRHVASMP